MSKTIALIAHQYLSQFFPLLLLFGYHTTMLNLQKQKILASLYNTHFDAFNLSALMVLRRPLIFRAIGYFAAIESLFPMRCMSLMAAWRRLGLPIEAMSYHQEHVKIDVQHAHGFFTNVIQPLVEMKPELAREISWGVHARLNSSTRHLDALLTSLDNKVSDAPSCLSAHTGS